MNKNKHLDFYIALIIVCMGLSLGWGVYLYITTDDLSGVGHIISGLATTFTGFSAILTVLAMLRGRLSQQIWEAFGMMQECNSKIRRLQATVRNIENMGFPKFPDMRDRNVITQITLSLDIDAQEWKSMQFVNDGETLTRQITDLQNSIDDYNSTLLKPHWNKSEQDLENELEDIRKQAKSIEKRINDIKLQKTKA